MRTFGKYARQKIKELGKSQKSLAEELGVSPAYISQIFSGKKSPPDLGRPRNRIQLRLWSTCLHADEDEILDVVRFELHRLPPRPDPRYRRMRELLIRKLEAGDAALAEEIRSLELHPAESRAIAALVKIYLILHYEHGDADEGLPDKLHERSCRALADRELVEGALVNFFEKHSFTWKWDPMANDVQLRSRSATIARAMSRIERFGEDITGLRHAAVVPVVGDVSAGEGFHHPGVSLASDEAREFSLLPPGTDPEAARRLYCVRVRDESLRELFGEGAMLFVKVNSSHEIRDGDVVIFRDESMKKAYVKKVEFAGDILILKARNPLYKDVLVGKSDIELLERVVSVVF
jgi:SOS-response transcriptional repressor LexA